MDVSVRVSIFSTYQMNPCGKLCGRAMVELLNSVINTRMRNYGIGSSVACLPGLTSHCAAP